MAEVMKLDLPGSLSQVPHLRDAVADTLRMLKGVEDAESICYNVQLAAQEIAVNIVEHAYNGGGDPERQRIRATLSVFQRPRRIEIELRDSGAPFNPTSLPNPSLDDVHEGGYGVFLARTLLDELACERESNGNCWRLIKNIP
jgi:anti-sigma regulatory factor (Ser/Thr protein kinase)